MSALHPTLHASVCHPPSPLPHNLPFCHSNSHVVIRVRPRLVVLSRSLLQQPHLSSSPSLAHLHLLSSSFAPHRRLHIPTTAVATISRDFVRKALVLDRIPIHARNRANIGVGIISGVLALHACRAPFDIAKRGNGLSPTPLFHLHRRMAPQCFHSAENMCAPIGLSHKSRGNNKSTIGEIPLGARPARQCASSQRYQVSSREREIEHRQSER